VVARRPHPRGGDGARRPQQGDAIAVVGRAARVYRSVGALQADFVQTITDPMLGPEESRGTLVQAGQNRLAMRFSDPEGDAIVVDGTWIWVYTPSTTPGQVVRMPVPTGPVYGFNILGWLLDKPVERYRSRYLRADTVGGRAVDVVEMVPLSEDIPFSRAVLWVDREDALPRRLDVKERGGLTRTLVLSSLRPNAPTTERTFAFRAPRGTKIVEQ
jgi:outer membrane lipoprotein carrier protein